MFGLNTYMLIGIAVLVAIMGIYFTYSQHEMKVLNQTIATQTIALKSQTLVIAQLKKDAVDIQATNAKLSTIVDVQTLQSKILQNKLNKLQGISTKKASLLQKLINDASKQRTRCIALATGAVPMKDETNRVCPQLLAPKKVKK